MAGISEDEKMKITETCFKTLRLEQLVFSRWAQVMYHFEKSMYENPDELLSLIEAKRERINGNAGYAKAVLIAILTSPSEPC